MPTRGQRLQEWDREIWERASDEQKTLVSLGSDWASLPAGLHTRVIGEVATHWSAVEAVYAAMNGVAL